MAEIQIPEGALQAVVVAAVVNALNTADAVRKIVNERIEERRADLETHVDKVFFEAFQQAIHVHEEAMIASFTAAFKGCFVRRY